MNINRKASITQAGRPRHAPWLICVTLVSLLLGSKAVPAPGTDERSRFQQAWQAAAHGDRDTFGRLEPGLSGYLLHPYLRYEDLRGRGARVDAAEMNAFVARHRDWAFASGLRAAWLRALGRSGRWQTLLDQAVENPDTVTRCYLASARIARGDTDDLLPVVQALWTAGRSQPKACDPAFEWLRDQGGITTALAWERIRLAMRAGNPRFTLYLERFLPPAERTWLTRWQALDRDGYRRLDRAHSWPDQPLQRMIAATSLLRLARRDPDRAMTVFRKLDGHFSWLPSEHGEVLREIALRAAVELSDDALDILAAVPAGQQDAQLLEWWARAAIARSEWALLDEVIGRLPPALRGDGRWRYWRAVALRSLGRQSAATALLQDLSSEATYYGFLAADALKLPYTICPQEPQADPAAVAALRRQPGFRRALELRAVGLHGWAESEWRLAASRLGSDELRAAAALARDEGWHDRVIFALGDSGERRWYEWRFPVLWEQTVEREASRQRLDKSWVLGVMRSESALAEQARSSAGALGLMQVTPATARRLAGRYGLNYGGSRQLLEAEPNIRFGTAFMRELLDRFNQNPVLVAGSYNAGPEAVERWLRSRPGTDAAAWVETIPYFETRDYIPRVLAFTAIYDWRLGRDVTRISSRMPDIDSGNIGPAEIAQVVCKASG